jgi:parallel beta-helix repeat protein
MRHLPRGLTATAATACLLLVVFPSTAGAQTIGCGDVLVRNTVLRNDVGPCPDNGLVIGADDVRLDLNGHRVFGTADPGDGAGVLVSKRSGVTVTNGTVTGFDAGVVIEGGSGNRVTGVTARDNIGRATVFGVPGTQYGDGIAILSSTGNLLLRNTVVNNGPYSGIGLFQEVDRDHPRQVTGPTTENVVNGNVVKDNNACRVEPGHERFPGGFCDNDGIRLEPGVHANKVLNNTVTGSALDGIAVFSRSSTDNEIRNNTVEGNGFHGARHRKGDGIRVFGGAAGADRTQITANAVFGNAANGIRVDSKSNNILGNKTGGNVAVPDPRFFLQSDLHDSNPDCDENLWRGNTYDRAYPDCTTG